MAPRAIPVLMYHKIDRPPPAPANRTLCVRPAAFRHQMAALRAAGIRGISMGEAMPYLRGERSGRIAVLTFDDGYADTVEQALPVLRRHGHSATCYVVSGQIDGHNAWDEPSPGSRASLMSADQLARWCAAGMEVGCHTATHPRLSRLDADGIRHELRDSRERLRALTGQPVDQFCYPYGDHDERVVAAVREAGFVASTTTERGRARPGGDLMRVPRIAIQHQHLLHAFLLKTLTSYGDRNRRASGRSY